MTVGGVFGKCILTVGLFSSLFHGHDPMIIAHRGASAIAPENTLSAFTLAWQMKTPAVECDIHLTADNQIVVCHDGNAKRTGGVDVNICNADYAKLSSLDMGSFKDGKYAGEKIPLLSQVIQTIPQNGTLFVEIKCDKKVLPFLRQVIDNSGKRKQLVIIGFNISVIAEAKKLMPDIPAYWLIKPEKNAAGKYLPYDSSIISKVKEEKLNGIDAYWEGLDKKFIQQIHNAGLKIYTWTVDDIDAAKNLKKIGIDGITSNRPDLIMNNI